jgi:hypothetical protein
MGGGNEEEDSDKNNHKVNNLARDPSNTRIIINLHDKMIYFPQFLIFSRFPKLSILFTKIII